MNMITGRCWLHDSAGAWLADVHDESGALIADLDWTPGHDVAVGAAVSMCGEIERGLSLVTIKPVRWAVGEACMADYPSLILTAHCAVTNMQEAGGGPQ